MKVDIENLRHFHEIGGLVQGDFGDAKETACLVSALTGATVFDDCEAEGWPPWLAEAAAYFFDTSPKNEIWERGFYLAKAIKIADESDADFDQVFRDFRLDSVLPIALEAIGDGDEPWRVECRNVVLSCIHRGGAKAGDATADARAAAYATAEAANATKVVAYAAGDASWDASYAAARAAGAAGAAAEAAGTAYAAGAAAWAAYAAGAAAEAAGTAKDFVSAVSARAAAGAAAIKAMHESLIKVLLASAKDVPLASAFASHAIE